MCVHSIKDPASLPEYQLLIVHSFRFFLDDLGRAVEELVTVITEQEGDTIDNGSNNPDVMIEQKN